MRVPVNPIIPTWIGKMKCAGEWEHFWTLPCGHVSRVCLETGDDDVPYPGLPCGDCMMARTFPTIGSNSNYASNAAALPARRSGVSWSGVLLLFFLALSAVGVVTCLVRLIRALRAL